MSRTTSKPEPVNAEAVSSQATTLKQIGFHGALIMFTALLIAGVLKAF
jgi:hypothetical protein